MGLTSRLVLISVGMNNMKCVIITVFYFKLLSADVIIEMLLGIYQLLQPKVSYNGKTHFQ